MTNLLRWLNILLVLLTLLCYLSPYINPAYFSWLNILGTAYPELLLLNLLFVFYWFFRRRRYWWYSVLVVATGWFYVENFFGFDFKKNTVSPDAITIMSYNVSLFHTPSGGGKRTDTTEFSNFIASKDPDIICIQEIGLRKNVSEKYIRRYYALSKYPYRHHHRDLNSVILSKYPFRDTGFVDMQSRVNGCIYADIEVPGKTIRVYSTHLQSNQITESANELIESGTADLDEKETWQQARSILGKVRSVAAVRATQAQLLAQHKKNAPYPVIICGDFNETPFSYVYHTLSKGMQDSFREKGHGLGTTFAGKIPLLRIDYILADPSFIIEDFTIPKVRFSDHFPVIASIKM